MILVLRKLKEKTTTKDMPTLDAQTETEDETVEKSTGNTYVII